MANKIYRGKADDPRFQLQRAVRLMRKTLGNLGEASKREEVRSENGVVIQAGGLQSKEIESLVSITRALHALARQADADDVSRARQLKGMTDEQLAEMEKKLRSAEHSEKIKEGLRRRALDKEVPIEEENEDGED